MDFLNFSGTLVNFLQNTVVFENSANTQTMVALLPEFTLDALDVALRQQILLQSFRLLFSDELGLTYVISWARDTEHSSPVMRWSCRYKKPKSAILEYDVAKMLTLGTIEPCDSPYASPVSMQDGKGQTQLNSNVKIVIKLEAKQVKSKHFRKTFRCSHKGIVFCMNMDTISFCAGTNINEIRIINLISL